MIDYSPLWMTMKEKHISQYYLLQHNIDNRTLNALKKNKNITLLTLEKLCRLLDCTPNDIVSFREDEEEKPQLRAFFISFYPNKRFVHFSRIDIAFFHITHHP